MHLSPLLCALWLAQAIPAAQPAKAPAPAPPPAAAAASPATPSDQPTAPPAPAVKETLSVLDLDDATQRAIEFAKAIKSGQTDDLANLGTDPFNFDGREVKDRSAIAKAWAVILDRQKRSGFEEQPNVKVTGYDLAVEQFGKAPEKFAKLGLKRCAFAVVTYEKRPGLLLILTKVQDSWKVAAATD